MKNFILFFATVFCALTAKAQQPVSVDSVSTNWNSVTAYTHVDSGTYYQFELLNGSMVHIANSAQWVMSQDDTLPVSETFQNLDTMTAYYVRVNTFPNVTGVPFSFTTDTLITMPVITRGATTLYPSLGAARLYFTVSGGYDTSWVEVQVNTNPSFPNGFGNAVMTYHIPWGGGSGNLYFTGLPQNQTLYKRYRVRNSQYTSQWLFNVAVDTFGLWTGTVVVNPTVTTDDSVANYNSVTLNGSATVSNLLRIRYGYSYSDVANSGGYPVGTVPGSQSSLSTSATVLVQPNTVIYYRAESETSTGAIYGNIKSVTSWSFPTMPMPVSWVDTTFTSADFIFTPNTSGISADSFIVEVGSPTLSFLEQRFHVGTVGVKNGSQQFAFTVSGLTAGTQYQLKITCYAFTGVIAATSSTVTFTTPTPGTVQTSAAWANVTGVQDQLLVSNVTKSRVQLQVQSENLTSTAWLEINNDWDTTNFYSPITINLPSYTTGATPVYESFDVAAADVTQSWDQYSDIYGRYIVRVVIYNSDNTGPHYSSWQYFYPRGLPSGIAEEKNIQFSFFPNPVSDQLYVSFEADKEQDVKLYALTGQLIAEQKVKDTAIFSTANLVAGTYLLQVGHTTKKVLKQ